MAINHHYGLPPADLRKIPQGFARPAARRGYARQINDLLSLVGLRPPFVGFSLATASQVTVVGCPAARRSYARQYLRFAELVGAEAPPFDSS